MKEFSIKETINASPQTIWAILTDAPKFPEWNPGVEKIEGRIAAGEKITVYATLTPGRAFPTKVSEFVPEKKMVWTGGMPLGLFKGERTFTLTPTSDGRTEFFMREVFSGLLAPLITRSIPDLTPSFEQYANGLKNRAENNGS